MKQRIRLNTKGIVQGVGFRPYVYSLANKHKLAGHVLNNSGGVYIELEGEADNISEFLVDFEAKKPALSRIDEVGKETIQVKGEDKFSIRPSRILDDKFTFVSCDIAICNKCNKELNDFTNRRCQYPFINCTNCGARFSLVNDIPYDRASTTMDEFKMCDDCLKEYEDYTNRRFHAQTISCSKCGPKIGLFKDENKRIDTKDVIKESARFLKKGYILAIKGLGGYHLACDAYNSKAVRTLRKRKLRPSKPLAIMAKNIGEVRNLCFISKHEEEELTSFRKPIVLLKKKNSKIAKGISPGLDEIGIMLAYTPLQVLLLEEFGRALVMTSGNSTSESIIKENNVAFKKLGSIADYFLNHNLKIHSRCDDSVVRVMESDKTYFIRRSRGYVPSPIKVSNNFSLPIAAFGGNLKNTFCIAKDNYAFLSQHIGDLDNLSTIENFKEAFLHFLKLFSIKPEVVTCDLHPEYTSTHMALDYANGNNIEDIIKVQHHHAHIASCMCENNIYDDVIGISWDGTGYGDDGAIWGGEFLVANRASYERKAHFKYVSMPGLDKAITQPWRMGLSWLYEVYKEDAFNLDVRFIRDIKVKDRNVIKSMIDNNINSALTSSVSRLFSAVSSILLKIYNEDYEGQASIMFEHLSRVGKTLDSIDKYSYEIIKEPGLFIINPDSIIRAVVNDILKGEDPVKIGYRFHITLGFLILEVTKLINKDTNLKKVVLSGGVFQNMLLLEESIRLLRNEGFEVFIHSKVPTNDGGISLGQVTVCDAKLRKI